MNIQALVSDVTNSDLSKKPGAMLRKIREELNLTVAEIAIQLCLSKSIIEAIEADDFEKLHGTTFVRGYLRAYAKLVGAVPDDIINAFNVTYPDNRQRAPAPQRDYQHRVIKQKIRNETSVKLVGYGLLVAMLILMLWWWHNHNNIKQSTTLMTVNNTTTLSKPTNAVANNALPNAAETTAAIGPGVDQQTQMTIISPLASNVQQAVTHTPALSEDKAMTNQAVINNTIANAAAVPGINPSVSDTIADTTTRTNNPQKMSKVDTGWKNPDL